jgi:hypothetical protein
MAQVSADMMGMATEESIRYMENELESMGVDDSDATVMGMIFAANGNMSIKQSTAKLGYEATMESCKAEMSRFICAIQSSRSIGTS